MALKTTLPGIPECDRPYEKLELYGASSLSDSELLAVILRSGTKDMNVVDVAKELLFAFDGKLKNVCGAGVGELLAVKGIGRVKAIQLKAAGEMALRIEREFKWMAETGGDVEKIGEFFVQELWNEPGEVFSMVMLDKRLRIIGYRVVSRGILDRTIVHPREIFQPAVKELAYAVVVAHNHPSGDTTPSREDISLTARLKQAGDIMGITLLDHIIVGRKQFSSFKELGIMDRFESLRFDKAV